MPDVQALDTLVGEDVPREVLLHAEIEEFNARSWACWHYRLSLAEWSTLPPLIRIFWN